MLKNPFKKKILKIKDDDIKLCFGFYDVQKLQDKIDEIIVVARLLDYKITTFWAVNNTGFFFIIDKSQDSPISYASMNFHIELGRMNSIEIYHRNSSDYISNLFYVKDEKRLLEELNIVLEGL